MHHMEFTTSMLRSNVHNYTVLITADAGAAINSTIEN